MHDGGAGSRRIEAISAKALRQAVVETGAMSDPNTEMYRAEMCRAAALARRPDGFTLIELMIVVAAVAILAAIAVPSYNDAVRKSRRGQAKADLVECAQTAERHHTSFNSYATFTLPVNSSPREAGATARYTLALNPAPGQSTFTITATALNDQANDT